MQTITIEHRAMTREMPSCSEAAYAEDDNIAYKLYALLTEENKERVNRFVASLKEA